MGCSLAQDSLGTGTSNVLLQGFSDVLVLQEEQGLPAALALLTAGSKGLPCFGKKGAPSFFSRLIPELRSFERASDTQALQNLLEQLLTLPFWVFLQQRGLKQAEHGGCIRAAHLIPL